MEIWRFGYLDIWRSGDMENELWRYEEELRRDFRRQDGHPDYAAHDVHSPDRAARIVKFDGRLCTRSIFGIIKQTVRDHRPDLVASNLSISSLGTVLTDDKGKNTIFYIKIHK